MRERDKDRIIENLILFSPVIIFALVVLAFYAGRWGHHVLYLHRYTASTAEKVLAGLAYYGFALPVFHGLRLLGYAVVAALVLYIIYLGTRSYEEWCRKQWEEHEKWCAEMERWRAHVEAEEGVCRERDG